MRGDPICFPHWDIAHAVRATSKQLARRTRSWLLSAQALARSRTAHSSASARQGRNWRLGHVTNVCGVLAQGFQLLTGYARDEVLGRLHLHHLQSASGKPLRKMEQLCARNCRFLNRGCVVPKEDPGEWESHVSCRDLQSGPRVAAGERLVPRAEALSPALKGKPPALPLFRLGGNKNLPAVTGN